MKHYSDGSVHAHPSDSLASPEFDYPKRIPYRVRTATVVDAWSETELKASDQSSGKTYRYWVSPATKIYGIGGSEVRITDLESGWTLLIAEEDSTSSHEHKAKKIVVLETSGDKSVAKTHTDFGVDFFRPANWKTEEGSTHDFDYVRIQAPNMCSFVHPEAVLTRTPQAHDNLTSLDAVRDHWLGLELGYTSAPTFRRFSIDGGEALEATFERHVNSYVVHTTLVATLRGDYLYQLRYDAIDEDHLGTWDQFNQLVSSITLDPTI